MRHNARSGGNGKDKGRPSARVTAQDDLSVINGIGARWAKAMRAIGIRRYADLARHTPETLKAALHGHATSKLAAKRIEHEKWIDQARRLADRAVHQISRPEQARNQSGGNTRTLGEFTMFFDAITGAGGKLDWQVRIYDGESGEEVTLSPAEREHWADWVMRRARLPTRTAADASSVELTGHQSEPAIEVIDVQLRSSRSGRRPHTEIRFRLSGIEAEHLTLERTPYRVEFYAVDLENRAPALLASREGHLLPRVFEYTDEQDLPPLNLGRYELHSMVFLLPPAERVACHRGPVINVVP
jgi:hypothetical protein